MNRALNTYLLLQLFEFRSELAIRSLHGLINYSGSLWSGLSDNLPFFPI